MINELGGNNIAEVKPFALSDTEVKSFKETALNDMFRPINLDNVPGGQETIQSLVKEALDKELKGFENLKQIRVTSDGELYVGTQRYVQAREIFKEA